MSIESLVTLLTTAKFDVYLGEAPDGAACPYIVLTDVENPNFAADNKTYTETTSLRLRLVESEVNSEEHTRRSVTSLQCDACRRHFRECM